MIYAITEGHSDIASLLAEKTKITDRITYLKARDYSRRRGISVPEIPYSDVNAHDEEGRTMLMIATEQECLDVAEALIEKGADINGKELFGGDPVFQLFSAVFVGYSGISLKLVKFKL